MTDNAIDTSMMAHLHARVAHWAGVRPDATALVSGAEVLTYHELDQRAHRIAAALGQAGVRRGDRVGLLAKPGPDAVAAILGVLKSGAAYVPLDTCDPPERTADLVRNQECCLVLTTVPPDQV